MRLANYLLFRYAIRSEDGRDIPRNEQFGTLSFVKGRPTAYRQADADVEPTNVVMRVRQENMCGEYALVFDVGYRVVQRTESRWNAENDDYDVVFADADDTVFTRFIAVPELGLVGVKDGSGDRLAARSGMARLKRIIETHLDLQFLYSATASPQDVDRALHTLRLTEFNFEVRPFNPHPSSPGDRLDELMKEAGVGKLRGRAIPAPSERMNADDEGLLAEAVGLTRKGYGQFSMKGETGSGAQLSYGRPDFQTDRDKNTAAAGKPRGLKVAVPTLDTDMTEEEHVVRVILELFDDRS